MKPKAGKGEGRWKALVSNNPAWLAPSAIGVVGQFLIADAIVCRSFKPWLHPEIIFRMSSTGRGHAKALAVLHGLTEKVTSNGF
uniref:Uncharacterized protein n=1 Tax=Timema genevievae TaxID=629358 RepID=A0A7R9K9F0_TIMGE|nr:unnamed protein product [Timema genevievae]